MNPPYFGNPRRIALLGLLALCGLGFTKPELERLPNLDKRRGAGATPEQTAATARLREQLPAAQVDFDRVTSAPRFVSARDGFLTGRNGLGRAVASAHQFVGDEHGATKAFLHQHRALFGHGPEVLERARVARDFTSAHNGLRTVAWAQAVDGVEVFGALLISHTTRNGELVNLFSQLVPDAPGAAMRGATNHAAFVRNPTVSARRAAMLAAHNVGDAVEETEIEMVANASQNDPPKQQKFRARAFAGDADAKLVWLPLNRSQLRLCWEIVSLSRLRGEMFRVLVDAQSGEVLLRHSLTEYLSDATYRVWTSDSPSPFSPGNTNSLITNQPPLVGRSLLTLAALDTNASPAGWIADGGNETLGNNVDAHTDRDANNLPDLPRPQGSPARTFDFTLNLSQDPTNYSSAAVVQLFYLNNWIHDKLYALGFTEAAGNFQSSNFGRGGLGGDAMSADAQDGSGFNNANLSVSSDGSPPRMQMYIFNYPNPRRDGDLDAEIVIHEYVHGLSNRRVGGGGGLFATQSRGMGEGWSDFYALALLSQSSDDVSATYAMGGYAMHQFLTPNYLNNYYFGVRRYPYSTDLAKNPLTFKDIDPRQASAHTNAPLSPLFTPFSPSSASEVHNEGEVWCVTLWEARANLVIAHGWAAGSQLALQLVTDGMNLSPANPNFLQARDGIIQADLVNNGGANSNALWAAFAKRGLGFSAISPDSSTTDDVIEAFDFPNELRVSPPLGMVAKGPLGGPYTNTQTLTISNAGLAPISWSLVNTSAWLAFSASDGTLASGVVTSIVASVGAAANSLPYGVHEANVMFTNVTSGGGPARLFKLLAGARDYFTMPIQGDNPLEFSSFTFTADGSDGFYSVCREIAAAYPTDPAGGTVLTMGDDTNIMVTLTSTNAFGIYGQRTNKFFVGSNGYLTTGSGDTAYQPTYAAHFNLPRATGIFTDLHPGTGGTISWRELADRVAVTWNAVPEYGNTSQTNSFQIELFFDNRIRLTFLTMETVFGISGLSAGGGLPLIFDPSDFTTYGGCASAPTIVTQPESQTVPAGAAVMLTVTATGSTPLDYQWWKDAAPLAAATNAVLNFPVVQPSDAGDYSVIVTNSFGAVTSIVATLIVTNPPVIANFTGTPVSGGAPHAVLFTNLSSGATNYFWDFGDGHTSAAGNPSNTYTNAGTNTVTLTAVGWSGTNVFTRTNYITVTNLPPLIANFTGTPTSGGAPLTVAFTNASSGATSYSWNFGDGGTSTTTNLTHVFTNAGIYTVSLASQRSNGTNLLTRTNYIVVTNSAPVIVTPPVSLVVNAGTNATFTVVATGTPVLTYQWRFNGTNLSGSTATSYTRTNAQAVDAGNYSVVVSNFVGSVTSAVATLAVAPDGFIAVNGSPYGQNFDGIGPGGISTPSGWFVGTGTGPISGTNVTVDNGTSNDGGNYNFGTSGSSDRALGSLAANSTQRDIEARFVNVSGQSIASFTITYEGEQWRVGGNGAVNNDLVMQFSLNGGSFTEMGASFNFNTPLDSAGAGALDGTAASNRVTGIGGIFTPATPLTNNQVFYLRWADEDNSSTDHAMGLDDFVITFTLTNTTPSTPAPVANFSASPTNGLAPLTVNFGNLSSNATNYLWDFGDGNSSTLANPVSTYTNAGSYTVILTAVGPGGTNVLSRLNYIVATNPPALPPVPNFAASTTNGYAPLAVQMTNLTTAATNYFWDFGDGNTATTVDAANVFSNAGSYTITLTAIGPGGTNTLARTNYIFVANPPVLVSLNYDSAGFFFTFNTLPGHIYSVQFKDSLAETNWQPLLPALPGTGAAVTFTNSPVTPMRFFRVQAQ